MAGERCAYKERHNLLLASPPRHPLAALIITVRMLLYYGVFSLANEERFSLTGAAPDRGALSARPVRRAAERKTLFIIICRDARSRGLGRPYRYGYP